MIVAENASRQKDVVVFVDDQPEILDALRRILRDEQYEVRTTSSPDEALRWVGEGDVSVLVTDERMPTMRGTDLLEKASKRSPKTVRVVLTGYPGSYTLHYGLAHSVDWLISKPWNDEALKLNARCQELEPAVEHHRRNFERFTAAKQGKSPPKTTGEADEI